MNRDIKIYNTLTSKKEVFNPISKDVVGMYVCGPTAFGAPHLVHARSAITFDLIFRFLSFMGYKVRYVRNITDVWHLEDEQNDSGEDKIQKRDRLQKLEPMEIVQYYTNVNRDAMRKLNGRDPSIEPSASGHIPGQIETVQKIIDNGLGHIVNGSVYFDVQAYVARYNYGELWESFWGIKSHFRRILKRNPGKEVYCCIRQNLSAVYRLIQKQMPTRIWLNKSISSATTVPPICAIISTLPN